MNDVCVCVCVCVCVFHNYHHDILLLIWKDKITPLYLFLFINQKILSLLFYFISEANSYKSVYVYWKTGEVLELWLHFETP